MEQAMAEVTDEMMRQWREQTAPYSLMILRKNPDFPAEEAGKIIWEHGRRNMSLYADGVLPVVCPVPDDTDVAGIGIFAADLDEARQIMDDDPGVRAGLFTYELHPCRSLPGSTLPPR
jgi:uncharacterized protein YciI